MANLTEPKVDLSKIPDDVGWLRASFLMSESSFNEAIINARRYNTADDKFQNTSLGGNYAINIPPQFTHTADPNVTGLGSGVDVERRGTSLGEKADDVGMGMYYSEAIDDNKEVIHMRFGVPEFNSLAKFINNSYDSDLAKLARKGEASTSLIEFVGKMIGTTAGFVVGVPLFAISVAGRLFNFARKLLSGGGFYLNSARYYYIKSTMRLYWKTVNQMTNTLAINLGILPAYMWDGSYNDYEKNRYTYFDVGSNKNDNLKRSRAHLTPEIVEQMHLALPDIFRKEGGVDVRSVANKAKRLEMARQKRILTILEEFEGNPDINTLSNSLNEYLLDKKVEYDVPENQSPTEWFMEYLNSFFTTDTGEDNIDQVISKSIENQEKGETEESATSTDKVFSIMTDSLNRWIYENGEPDSPPNDSMFSYMEAERYSGSDWVTFKVVGEKTVNESFSNDSGQPAIAEKLNSASGAATEARFGYAGGNIGIPGLQSVIDLVSSTAEAAVSTFSKVSGFSGLGILLGGGYIDVPNVWKGSTSNLPKMEYKFELRATYGNKISIFTDIYVPLMMLMAATLPLSTGRASYTSPFLVEVYRKGKSQIRTGIVESLSITRGVGNSGWSVDQLPLAVDVSMTIADMSTIMHMPIMESFGAYDDSSAYSDYMATLGSLGLMDITAWQNVLQRTKAAFKQDWGNALFNSKSALATFTMNAGIDIFGTNVSIRNLVNVLGDVEKIGR